MRCVILAVVLTFGAAMHAAAADPLPEARRLYNAGQYEEAVRYAREAIAVATTADAARIVLGRAQLERFRQTADAADLSAARDALRDVDPQPLSYRDRIELAVGQAEALYLEDRFGAAAELFEAVLDKSSALGSQAHERVLDWWATAMDRTAQQLDSADREPIYRRVLERMQQEVAIDPGSTPGSYWIVAASRGIGDLDRAYQAALAGWVRASMAADRGAALRSDIDRIVTQAIIPERAARLPARDSRQAQSGMLNEWEAFKGGWSK